MEAPHDSDAKPRGVLPAIDPNRCEGKEDCVRVCPHGVFTMVTVTAEHRAAMSLIGRLKARAHGNRQARVAHPVACHSCGLCVMVCRGKAIKLVKA